MLPSPAPSVLLLITSYKEAIKTVGFKGLLSKTGSVVYKALTYQHTVLCP